MDGSDTSKALRALEALRSAIRDENATAAEAAIEGLSVSDGARTLLHLDQAEQVKAIELIDPEVAARVVEQMPDGSAAALIEGLDPDDAVEIFDELDSDDQADILGEMDDEDAEAILDGMGRSDSRAVRRLMSFPDDTAGGIMMLEVFKFRESETVADVLRRLIHQGEDFERYRGQHPYVVSDKEHLRGVVSLRRLLTSSRTSLLQNVMSPATSVRPETPISLLRDIFDENAFLGLPVVDQEGMLLGVVSRDALTEAELERAEADVQKLQGIVNEELRSMPTWLRARRRLSWLTVNIGLNILAASVIALYEDTLAAVIALAVFLPIVSDMSGCSGNQAVAVSLRELSLGVTRPADLGRVWLKEVGVGLINGIALGVLIALAAWLWKGNAYIGLVVGVALALNTVIAVSIGGTVPLILKRFNVDPAVASGPMLTTITDVRLFSRPKSCFGDVAASDLKPCGRFDKAREARFDVIVSYYRFTLRRLAMLPASFGAPCAQSEPGIGDNELNKDKPRVGVHGSGLPTIHATLTPQGAPRLLVMFHRALLWTSQHLEPASGGRICTAQRQALTGSRIPQSSRSLLFFK